MPTLKSGKPLHLLVNNAGIYTGGKTKQDIEGVFGTNYLGHFALTQFLTPLLIKSKPSRVVNVASMMHRFGRIDYEDASKHQAKTAYCDSKLYQIMAGREMHRRLRSQGVSVYSVHPGAVNSNFNFYHYMGATAEKIMKKAVSLYFLTPEQGARTALSAALDQPQNENGEGMSANMHFVVSTKH